MLLKASSGQASYRFKQRYILHSCNEANNVAHLRTLSINTQSTQLNADKLIDYKSNLMPCANGNLSV